MLSALLLLQVPQGTLNRIGNRDLNKGEIARKVEHRPGTTEVLNVVLVNSNQVVRYANPNGRGEFRLPKKGYDGFVAMLAQTNLEDLRDLPKASGPPKGEATTYHLRLGSVVSKWEAWRYAPDPDVPIVKAFRLLPIP